MRQLFKTIETLWRHLHGSLCQCYIQYKELVSFIVKKVQIFKPSRRSGTESDCKRNVYRFDSHSEKLKFFFALHWTMRCVEFLLTHHGMSRKLDGKRPTQCNNIKLLLPTLLYVGYTVKLKTRTEITLVVVTCFKFHSGIVFDKNVMI